MKTHFLFFALGLTILSTACNRENGPLPGVADHELTGQAADRCGCMAPDALEADHTGPVSLDLSWNVMPEAVGYRVEITSAGFHDTDGDFTGICLTQTTEENRLSLAKLTPNTSYQYRVTTLCSNDESASSKITAFETRATVTGDPGPEHKKLTGAPPEDQ